MESSNLYTFQKPVGGRKKQWGSTIAITALTIFGAVGIDLWLNPNALALFSPSKGSSADTANTAVGDTVDSGFGPVQLKVTKTGGKITSIELMQAESSGGREAAFPLLVRAALLANGPDFSNVSQATYSTGAFKESLKSALAKLP